MTMSVRKSIILIFVLLLSHKVIFSQQEVMYSQYMFDKMLVNPAFAGSSKWLVGSLKSRTSVMNIEGAPLSNFFTFQAPLQTKNIGVGIKVVQDKISVINSFNASGFFSYHIGFGNGKLSFGLEGGMKNSIYNYDNLVKYDLVDDAIPVGEQSAIIPDASAGVYYQTQEFYVGLSANHLINSKRTLLIYERNNIQNMAPNFYAIGGYIFEIGRDGLLEPGFLIKYMHGISLQVDANLTFIYLERFGFGLSYRSGDAIVALLKFDITKNIKISYSYDYTISGLSDYSSGAHEISISYGIELRPPAAKKVVHPRYYF